MDAEDEIVGEEPNLLVTASGLDIYEAVEEVTGLGGVIYPAHIDRTSYSVLSNLGFLPPDLNVGAVEITAKAREAMQNEYRNFNIVTSSDAHYLGDIAEPVYSLDVLHKNVEEILMILSLKNNEICGFFETYVL